MAKKSRKTKKYRESTELVHTGRDHAEYFGILNPPVVRASSIVFPDLESYSDRSHVKHWYGRTGTPLSDKFEEAMTMLEGGYNAVAAPSGLSAILTAVLAFAQAGDHMLVSDALYGSARKMFDALMPRFGITVEYYNPLIGAGIAKKIRKNTAIIYMESPGSATFEIMDVRTIAAIARKHRITSILDNSWATGLLFKPFTHGVDVSVVSATKYVSGHSDLMLGVAVAGSKAAYDTVKKTALNLGVCAGSEELYLALRGLRTMKVRLKQHAENALIVAKWLQKHPKVQRVYYPALPSDPNHKAWKKDFKGANGLMSILLKPAPKKKVAAFVDALELFPVAASWGGYESLLQPQYLKDQRTVPQWTEDGALLRLHIGLEDPEDLIADLAQGLRRL